MLGRAVKVAVAAVVIAAAVVGATSWSGPVGAAPHGAGHRAASVTGIPPIAARPGASALGCLALASTGMTAGQVQQVSSAISALGAAGGTVQMVAPCPGGPVIVGLDPGQEALAHRLTAQYGRDVSITVGLNAYTGAPVRSPTCRAVPRTDPLPAGLELSTVLDRPTVRPGGSFGGTVVVHERGPGSFFMDTGQPLVAEVVKTGTRQVVGVFNGAVGGTGYGARLGPGGSESIPFVGGTARCDGGFGSALPPGTYQVVVRVAPETAPGEPAYLSSPVTLHVGR